MITAFMTSREMYWKTRTGTAPVAKNSARLSPSGAASFWKV